MKDILKECFNGTDPIITRKCNMMENKRKPGEAYDQFIARARGLEKGEASKRYTPATAG